LSPVFIRGFLYFYYMLRYILISIVSICFVHESIAQKKELVDAIKKYAYPIATPNPVGPDKDLAFLESLLKDKSVIALGESTHGTKEFFQMKHRLVRYMVEELDYTIFAIEANFSECLAINDYVMYGKGDPELALRGIYFWTWNTEEVLDMIQWMRQYNEYNVDTDKVRFLGFDMQYAIGAAKAVQSTLKELAIDYQEYQTILDSLELSKGYISNMDSAGQLLILATLQKLQQEAESNEKLFIGNKSGKDYQLFLQHINILVQSVKYNNAADGYRDSCMAANIKWITEYEKADRIVLWAHNAHISKSRMSEQMSYNMMGYWLRKIYGHKYYAIGFDFNTGNFRSKEAWFISESTKMSYRMKEFSITKTRKNTSNYIFAQAGMPILFLDYRSSDSNTAINKFVSNSIKTKVIGATYWPGKEEEYYFTLTLKEAFDATLFIDRTTASVPIASYARYVEEAKKQ